jgi:hypothetical protein
MNHDVIIIHRRGAEDGETAQRITEAVINSLCYLSVLCASAVNGLYSHLTLLKEGIKRVSI